MEEAVPLQTLEILGGNLRILARRRQRGVAMQVGQDIEAVLVAVLSTSTLLTGMSPLLSQPPYERPIAGRLPSMNSI